MKELASTNAGPLRNPPPSKTEELLMKALALTVAVTTAVIAPPNWAVFE